jgi:GntR family transcriptional regulator of arabinose operon
MPVKYNKAQYKRIAEIIKRRIIKGKYTVAEKMPSENELLKEFKVSKHTLLKSLNALINQGYIVRRQGSGTFVAPALEEGRNRRICLIAYHSDNPYYSKIIKAVEEFAFERGFGVVLCNSSGSAEKENEYVERFMDEVDAFIVCPSQDEAGYSMGVKAIIDTEVPLVFVSHTAFDQLTVRCNYVIPDNCAGGFLAGKHLLECRYEKKLFLVNREHFEKENIKERFKGFKLAMTQDNAAFDDSCIVFCGSRDPENGYMLDGYAIADEIAALAQDSSAGVFALGDQMAIGLMKGLRERGVNVPKEVGICGFDDIELASQWGIELTTIAQNAGTIGRRASEILFSILDDPFNEHKPQQTIVPVELVSRKTTVKL